MCLAYLGGGAAVGYSMGEKKEKAKKLLNNPLVGGLAPKSWKNKAVDLVSPSKKDKSPSPTPAASSTKRKKLLLGSAAGRVEDKSVVNTGFLTY